MTTAFLPTASLRFLLEACKGVQQQLLLLQAVARGTVRIKIEE